MRVLSRLLKILLPVTIITPLLCLPLYAQQTEQPADAADQETDQQEENSGQNTDQQAESGQDDTLPDIDNQPIQPGSGGPGRFIPSEQISQDLGVSFPVDI